MTKKLKRSVRDNIKRRTITQLQRSKLRDHVKNKRNKIIVIDPHQIRETIYRKEISRRNDKKELNQNQ